MNQTPVVLNIMVMVVYGIIAYAVLLLMEYGVFRKMGAFIANKMSKKQDVQKKEVDKPSAIDDPSTIGDPSAIDDPSTIGDPSAIADPSAIVDPSLTDVASTATDDDVDVLAEKQLIENMTDEQLRAQAIVMKNVSKFHGKLCAVDNISLSIER